MAVVNKLCGEIGSFFLQFSDPLDPDADDFQNLQQSSLSKDASVVNFFHDDPISSFYVKLLTDRQTNRQTNASEAELNSSLIGKKNIRTVSRNYKTG